MQPEAYAGVSGLVCPARLLSWRKNHLSGLSLSCRSCTMRLMQPQGAGSAMPRPC